MRHLAALRLEEAALLGSAHAEESPLDEFAPQVK
jgi:hypothetical protein